MTKSTPKLNSLQGLFNNDSELVPVAANDTGGPGPDEAEGSVSGKHTAPSRLEAALTYAGQGFRVFPAIAGGKRPASSGWQQNASTDPGVLEQWFAGPDDYNLAVAVDEHHLVIDIDEKPGESGSASLTALEEAHGRCPPTVTTQTPTGGKHLLFRLPAGHRVKNSVGKIAVGLDIRAVGGLVIGVSSIHPNGGTYAWLEGHGLGEVEVAELPARWVTNVINAPRAEKARSRPPGEARVATATSNYGAAALRSECETVKKAKEGTRNDTLNVAALKIGHLVAGGEIVEDEAVEALTTAGLGAGLGADEVRGTVTSGMSAGLLEPRNAPVREDQGDGATPQIEDKRAELPRMVRQANEALAVSGLPLYRHAGTLGYVESPPGRSGPTGQRHSGPRFVEATVNRLMGDLAAIAFWFKWIKGEDDEPVQKRVAVPPQVVKTLLATPDWLVPGLSGISAVPVLRQDGSVFEAPGYDDVTGVLFCPTGIDFPPLAAEPTLRDATQALSELEDVLVDFPFDGPASRAVAVAAIVTAVVRPSLVGNTPLFLFNAPTQGSGKTLLTDVVSLIALGREVPKMGQTDRAETEKRITAAVIAASPLFVVDNVTSRVGGGPLESAITSGVWSGRRLGVSEQVELAMRMVIMVTGNNVTMSPDMTRRSLQCFLDPDVERPELRETFKHSNLRAVVAARRGNLVHAALTIVHVYRTLNRPAVRTTALGSFEAWAELIRDALVFAGASDPAETQRVLREEADTEGQAWASVIHILYATYGGDEFSASQVCSAQKPNGQFSGVGGPVDPARRGPLNEALLELCDGDVSPLMIGRLFARMKGKWSDGLRLSRTDRRLSRGYKWSISGRACIEDEQNKAVIEQVS